MKRKLICGLMFAGLAPMLLSANDSIAKPKFKITPNGRILADGALFFPHRNGFADGVAVPDIRAGVSATFGNWHAKVDIGYAFGKVGVKDVYMQYQFDDANLLRGGYFVHQFGLQSSTSSSMKSTFETPITDSYMKCTDRNIGLMYQYDKGKFLATASAIVGTKISEYANQNGKVSVGAITRLLWRPLRSQGMVAQVGLSGWYQTAFHQAIPDENDGTKINVSKGYFTYSANYPTRVDQLPLLATTVRNANGVVKLSPEMLLSAGRFALGGQYYYMNINRGHKNAFISNGAYGMLRGLILGDKSYGYSSAAGGLATPKPKTLECVLSYNYTNANTVRAGIEGGITNDWSVTLNYYINKYMLCRLRWSYTDVRNSSVVPDNSINILQARIQVIF
ncbi:MAG: ATPase [Muribaculaceae bacterium]|nr:ATPase [Muribaculaceae bacterium]